MIKFNVRGGAGDSTEPVTNVRPQDNLYLAVNSEWMKNNPIPEDEPWENSFNKIDERGRKNLLADLDAFAEGKKPIPKLKNFNKVVEFYKIAKDHDQREKDGAKPIQVDLNFLTKLKDYNDVNQNIKKLMVDFDLPFKLMVETDFKKSSLNVVSFYRGSLILNDKSYYEGEQTAKLLDVWRKQTLELLKLDGIQDSDAKDYVENAIKLDKQMVEFYQSAEWNSKVENIYNPISVADFERKSKTFDLTKLIQDCGFEDSELVLVTQPSYLDNFDKIFTKDNFAQLKGWLICQFVNNSAKYLSKEIRQAAMPLTKAMYGIESLSSDSRYVYNRANEIFYDVVGQYYGQTYLGEEARADATQMVKNMINIYKKRLHDNTWLSEATKKEAIKKLDTLGLKIGYPDKVQAFYDQFEVTPIDEGGSLYSNCKVNHHIKAENNFADLHKPVDHSKWDFSAAEANACYDPSCNDITLPAMILQKPFYDLHQDRAANYGGFGTVIGHEISHAFDNNGAQFDEKGNMKNWWTEEDFAEFDKRIKKEIDLFDGVNVGDVKINGALTVSENIGDQGGLTVALEANKAEGGSSKVLLENFARIWETNSKKSFLQLLANADVHSLPQARVNVQVQCQDAFYEAFDVKPGDGMWLDEDKRVKIW